MADLKLLGGRPAFDKMVPVSQPTMPDYARFEARMRQVYATGMITTSQFVSQLEKTMAEYLGVRNAVAVNSNTSGQLLTLKIWGLKGEVILPSFSFCVTSHVLEWNGLKPVFVDIDPKTCTIDPKAVEAAITPRTSAIMGMHLWGNPCRADELQALAKRKGLKFIIDSAQAMGSKLHGQRVGGFADAEVFSCSPTKMMTAGEGGIVATNDDILAAKLRKGRAYGVDYATYDCEFAGINARMSEFNAAFCLSSYDELEKNLAARKRAFSYYTKLLTGVPGVSFPEQTPGAESNCVYYTIIIDERAFGLTRNELFDAMGTENVMVKKYFDPPLHRLTTNRGVECRNLSVTEKMSKAVLTLPLYSHIEAPLQDKIVAVLKTIQKNAQAVRPALKKTAVAA